MTRTMQHTTAAAVLAAAVAAAAGLGGCALPTPPAPESTAGDCDRGDLAEHDRDCGYWDTRSGKFVYWSWVTPGVGGVPPSGWVPYLPADGSYVRPGTTATKTTVKTTAGKARPTTTTRKRTR